jgi:pimeloyl-ACP methyl ester carboxylesterase
MLEAHQQGSGKRLLLIHGLGGSWQSWSPVIAALAAKRDVIAIDLPGHGQSAAQPDSASFTGLVRSVEEYISEAGLAGIDVVGASLGGRIVLELARRGGVGNVVALDPGGFWRGWERNYFKTTLTLSLTLLQAIRSQLPRLSGSAVARSVLLAQLSARPWALAPELVERELTDFATTATVGPLIADLASGPVQQGPAAQSTGRVTIGWGRKDRLCPPRQASRARAAFPQARFHWIEGSGHYPLWDRPRTTAELILASTEDLQT